MNHKFLALLVCIAIVSGCQKPENEYVPDSAATAYPAQTIPDYPTGDSSWMRMDVRFPDQYTVNTPVVFVVPEGSFYSGTKADAAPLSDRFLARGYITVAMGYVYADTQGVFYPDSPYHRPSNVHIEHQVNDVRRAVIAYSNSARLWGSGTGTMYIAGHGHGATLAMLYAYGPYNADNNVRAVANLAGTTDYTVDNDAPYEPKTWLEQKRLAELFYRGIGELPLLANNDFIKTKSPYWVAETSSGKPTISIYPENNVLLNLPGEAARGLARTQALHDLLGTRGKANKLSLYTGSDHSFNGGAKGLDDAIKEAADFFKGK